MDFFWFKFCFKLDFIFSIRNLTGMSDDKKKMCIGLKIDREGSST
jgi:hypothetical protein